MEEIWKDVVGYEGLYQVSNLGNVRSLNYNGRKGYISHPKSTYITIAKVIQIFCSAKKKGEKLSAP